MAIVINPDGTVSTIETTHDQYGNIKPKIDSKAMKEQEIRHNKNTISKSSAKGYVYPTSTESGKKVSRTVSSPRPITITTGKIDKFFNKLRSTGKWLSPHEYQRIKNRLPKDLQTYFTSKYEFYIEQLRGLKEAMKRKTFSKPKSKKKKKASFQVKGFNSHHNSHNGNSIGEIAKFGSLKGEYASSSDYDVRTSDPPRPARPPKYAYARDRYGRVQERDSFNEEKKNEFYAAQNSQRNYDYSSYDANDDHDGAYNGWE